MSKTPKLKAHKMWANYYSRLILPDVHQTRNDALDGSGGAVTPRRVAVIPLDDVEALIARAAAAHYEAERNGRNERKPLTNGDCMRAALTAIGVLPPQRKGCK